MRRRSVLLNIVNIFSLFVIHLSASPRSLAAEQSSGVPAWLMAHVGEACPGNQSNVSRAHYSDVHAVSLRSSRLKLGLTSQRYFISFSLRASGLAGLFCLGSRKMERRLVTHFGTRQSGLSRLPDRDSAV